MLNRCLCLLFASLLPSYLFGNELLEYLQQYEGRWVGNFSIHSTASDYTESFALEQRYWWEEQVLHGLAVFERAHGMETTRSKMWVEDEHFIAEITRGESKEVFIGALHDGGLLWLPSNMERVNDYQIRETFVHKDDGTKKLRMEGFDTYLYAGGIAHIIYRGELTRQTERE